jgi:hypothetical protein
MKRAKRPRWIRIIGIKWVSLGERYREMLWSRRWVFISSDGNRDEVMVLVGGGR